MTAKGGFVFLIKDWVHSLLNYYKMAVAQVLSIASIILGIYIIGVFLFTQEEQIKHRIPLKSP